MEEAAKFIVYYDLEGRYRWRLRSLGGETIGASEIGHHGKSRCMQEMERWKLQYPDVCVRDATVSSFSPRNVGRVNMCYVADALYRDSQYSNNKR